MADDFDDSDDEDFISQLNTQNNQILQTQVHLLLLTITLSMVWLLEILIIKSWTEIHRFNDFKASYRRNNQQKQLGARLA